MPEFKKVGDVGVIRLDDGKANALGHALINDLHAGLDEAAHSCKAVLFCGRTGVFCAGFDLKEISQGPPQSTALVNAGASLLLRIFRHPQPVVAACTGHAIAAGALLLLASDTRIGARGEFQLGLNETAIGMSLPVFAIELARARLSMRHRTAAVIQGQLMDPQTAMDTGYLDVLTSPDEVFDRGLTTATQLAQLPAQAYGANKAALRQPYIDTIKSSLDS